jgi:hypothetical protein
MTNITPISNNRGRMGHGVPNSRKAVEVPNMTASVPLNAVQRPPREPIVDGIVMAVYAWEVSQVGQGICSMVYEALLLLPVTGISKRSASVTISKAGGSAR